MASLSRAASASPGLSRSGLIALVALIAVIGFTPWARGSEAPWAHFAFRALGLTALFVVSLWQSASAFPRSSWQGLAVRFLVLLVLLCVASSAFSIARGRSLEALLDLLSLTGIFLTTAMFVRGGNGLRAVALVEVAAAIPVAAIGVLQLIRPELLPAESSYGMRVLGPFGQPNRLGGYLIAAIPVALALYFTESKRIFKAALLVVAFGLALCLVATYSRGAWIGLAGGLLVLAVALARKPELRPQPLPVALALVCLLLPVLLLLPSVLSRAQPKAPTPAEWNLPFDPEREGSGPMRLAIWKSSVSAALQRPIVGSGPGTFLQAYDRSKSPTLKRLEAEGARTADHAHNHYLELFVECGALGLAAFVALAALSLGAAAAATAAGTSAVGRVLVAGFAGSVTALLANGALDYNLSLIPHSVLLFANLGILAAAPGPFSEPRRAVWAGRIGALAAVIAVAVALASYAASRKADEAGAYARTGRTDLAARDYAAASTLAPWNEGYAIAHAGQSTLLAGSSRREDALRDAEAAYRKAIRLNGSDPVTRHELARLYLSNRPLWGDEGVRKAIAQLRAAIAQNPYYAEIRNDLGVALLWSGDKTAAAGEFRQASEGRRSFVDPLLNLAAMAMESGDRDQARTWVVQALERDPTSGRAREMLEKLGGGAAPSP